MKASEKSLSVIKKWEGCHERLGNGLLKAYLCPAGIPTIGWGSTYNFEKKRPVQLGDVITQTQADQWLLIEADRYAAIIAERYPECNENQQAALTSLIYNIGQDGIQEGLHGLLKAKKWDEAADRILQYNKSNGEVLDGLVNRRKDERALFLTPVASTSTEATWFEGHRIDQNGTIVTGIAAMAGSTPAATWTGTDVDAFIEFRKQFPNARNLLIAPHDKPWPGDFQPDPEPQPTEVVVRVTRTGVKDNLGCERLLVTFEGTPDFMYMRSGVPSAQYFRRSDDSACYPGNLEPIPQAPKKTDYYYIHDIEWASGKKDDYSVNFSTALGPVKVWLENKFYMRRSEFLFHVDGGAPGTAGCLAVPTIAELKKLVALLRKHDPRKLYVDWNLPWKT